MTGQHDITLGGQRVPVQVSFDRFRTLRLTILPEGIVRVRAPRRTSLKHIQAYLESKAAWILRHIERFRARSEEAPPLRFVSGERHAYLGGAYLLQASQGERDAVRLVDGVFEVTTLFPPRPDRVRALMEAWYLEHARELFARLIRELRPRFDELGVARPKRLTLRTMTSRWGTCSRSGTITLNRDLIKMPLECVEYVVAHELCHLRHLGHDAAFYGLLAAIMPDWKKRRLRLRKLALAGLCP